MRPCAQSWTAVVVPFVALLLAEAAAPAQVARVGAEAGVSRSFPPAGLPDSAATYLEAGADLSLPVGAGSLFGAVRGGLSLAGETAGDWGVATLGARWIVPVSSGLGVGGTVTGQAFRVGPPGTYTAVTGRLQPELRWRGDGVTVSLRGRGAASHTEIETRSTTDGGGGPVLPGPGDPTTTLVTSDLSQMGGEARVRFDLDAGSLWFTGRAVDGDVGAYRSGGVGAALSTGPIRWNGSAALWDTPIGEELVGGLRLSVPLGGGWFSSGEGRQRAPDPLLGTPASADLSATLRREFTFTTGARRGLYRIGGRTPDGRRSVTFRLRRPAADSVAVLGDFSGWEPVPMRRSGDAWTARVPVAPGVYHFGFRVDGEWIVPDRATGVVSDEWGRENATLVVPEGSDG